MTTLSPRPVLIFDGDCGFCTTSARFATRWVGRRRYEVRPWQQLELTAYGLTEADCLAAAQFVPQDGVVLSGHRAIRAALLFGAPGWRPLAVILGLPGVDHLAARAYAWVADHRYQLPGTAACTMPGGPG